MTERSLVERLGDYLGDRWGTTVEVSAVRRMTGGVARTTWRCTASGEFGDRGLVFRTSGGDGAELSLSDDRLEFEVMRAAFGAGVPVAEPLFFEEDARWLGTGFVILEEVPDCETTSAGFTAAQRGTLAEDTWSILGRIARLDPDAMDLDGVLDPATAATCARAQLDHWTAIFRASCVHPDPIGEAAIRWMDATMPPPAHHLTLVHGDYRVGNLLFGRDGRVASVLDWEMAHRGDPLEDLAWSLDPRQAVDDPALAGGLAPPARAIALWEAASGMTVDPVALRWWQVFAAFKALAIWTRGARVYADQAPKRPALARIGWVLTERQQRVLADYLSPHSPHRLFEYRP